MEQIVIGKNIRKWRDFKGKKQASFAKEIGVSRVMLSRYENGRSKISLEHLNKIAISLGVDISDLIKEDKRA
ncbi:MAG: helix-turn-helix transcriptional regulator [Chitinophagaceae bacterium]|nr:helix-turn-helix transcriptional regulator [Chitinophagaceae bacterium]